MSRRRPRARREGARAAALEILVRVERGAFASILLEHHERRLDDRREGALLRRLVLGVLRSRSLLDHVIDRASSREAASIDVEIRALLRIGVYGLLFLDRVPDFAVVNSTVELARSRRHARATGFVNGVLRAVARRAGELLPADPREGDVAGLALCQSHPAWWVGRVVARQGWERAGSLVAANNLPAAPVIRPNTRRIGPDELGRELRAEGIDTRPCRFLPGSLRVVSGSPMRSRRLAAGDGWVQDEASQLVARLLGRPGRSPVLDLCAAPGGKTMELATGLSSAGMIVAVDRHLGRLRRLVRLADRLGLDQVRPVQADASRPLPLGARFDRLLVDAPCSGTGTLRGHPEIRWRLVEDDLARLATRQLALLRSAAAATVPGGRVVYSVCSMEPEEGEEVVRSFLDAEATFEIGDARAALGARCAELIDERGFLRTSPLDDGMDGFFAALLVRRS